MLLVKKKKVRILKTFFAAFTLCCCDGSVGDERGKKKTGREKTGNGDGDQKEGGGGGVN